MSDPKNERSADSVAPDADEKNRVEHTDATVFRDESTLLRTEPSLSVSGALSRGANSTGAGKPGEADAPKILKQRFVLEERVGSGGMGSVFRAKDLRKVEARDNNPHIAVKVLNNDFRQHPEAFIALEREASKSQTLRHSNIVSIFDFDKDGEIPFITMELLEGHELAELLQTYPAGLPPELAWNVIEGMVKGLAHAHEQGVVHADFKPGNVYVTDRQDTKILDFGIARAMRMNGTAEDTDFDPARLAALTPAYASREMLNGDNPEPRDDLYSLGVVIYLTLTGHHPYGRVPAHEAVKEGLSPVRIKGLSRRRWQVLEKCLAFNRQDRPRNAEDVYDGLFGKRPWMSISVAAAAAALTVATVVGAVQDNTEIRVVKEEVRQETLVDVQDRRIEQLLGEAEFDESWERALFSEMQTLKALSPTQEIVSAVEKKIAVTYASQIEASESLMEAFALLQSSAKFGFMAAAQARLEERLIVEFASLTELPLDAHWLEQAEQVFSYGTRYFANSSAIAASKASVVDYLELEMRRLIEAEDVLVAEQAWNTFSAQIFDVEIVAQVDVALADTLTNIEQRRRDRLEQRKRRELVARLDDKLGMSCLRLDIGALAHFVNDAKRQNPRYRGLINKRVGEKVTTCVGQLGTVDPDRALSLRAEALDRFGDFEQLEKGGVDPCSLHYLVGNGRQDGKGGVCRDEQALPDSAPQLVVVPGHDSIPKFAISKYEISWGEINSFCAQTGECPVRDEAALPVTGVSVATIEAYAKWLSEQTGYRYRLPTTKEWDQVIGAKDVASCGAEGDETTNESVLSPVSSAQSGAANGLGVVNALGNVLEVVKDGSSYVIFGAAVDSRGNVCVSPPQQKVVNNGDALVGFRLVREVS